MTLILAYQERNKTVDVYIKDANDETITPGAGDLVRIIIGREGETPKLSVTSGTDTANGSSVTKGAANRVRLDAQDLTFAPGTYTLFVDYFDSADASEWKSVDRQCFQLELT